MPPEIGASLEMEWAVDDTNTAHNMGNPGMHVLATPWLIDYFEVACHRLIEPHLKEGQGTVGVVVDVRHLAATPRGMKFRVRAEVAEVEGRRVAFQVEAHDEAEKIGEGRHERFIVDMDRFMARLDEKARSLPAPPSDPGM
jgi:fluoroacetyl-CoA thioesterase